MNIRLNNLGKLLKLKQSNNKKDYFDYFNNAYGNSAHVIILLFNITAFVFTIIIVMLSIFNDININGKIYTASDRNLIILIPILFSIIISWLIVLFIIKAAIYAGIKDNIDDDIQKFNNSLNQVYIDPNNEENVYLLHELIEKYGFKLNENDQENNNFIEFKLNTDIEFKRFENMEFSNKQIKDILLKNVIPFKELSNKQCEVFFYEYIKPHLTGKEMSFNEKEEMLKRITSSNDVKL